MREQRKLAAVLAADMVGYSRLMGRNEAGTLARLKEHRAQRLEPALARNGGRLVKLTGDGALAEFGSAVDALRAAIEFQQAVEEANALLADDQRIVFRIGLHLGDIIVEGDDIYGDAVNVAARLEAEALPSGIVVSRAVREAVTGRLKVALHDLGELALKNIERPIRAFRVEWTAEDWPARSAASEAAASPMEPAPALTLPDKPSIAVLPFQNMSGDPDQEYFADGIVEDITTGLSHIRSLVVVSRSSAFAYKGRSVDIRQVGRELGARYVLEGSVRRAGGRIRITGQLIDGETGHHVWADRFEGEAADVFQLQDRVTAAVVGAIEPSVLRAEIERSRRKRPDSLDAYDLYLRALPYAQVAMPGDADKALPLLQQALALQPDFAAAHASAAWCHEQRYLRGGMHEEDRAAGIAHARAALAAGHDDAVVLATAGFVVGLLEHDYGSAMEAINAALALNATSALALGLGATILAHDGRTEQAISYAERAITINPRDPTVYLPFIALAMAYSAEGAFDQVLLACRRAAQANPRFSVSFVLQAAALSRLGRLEEAKNAAKRTVELEPSFKVADFVRSHTGKAEIWAPIGDALRQAGLPE
jgi:TolB-like protein/class 3 adenylate cyclase